MSPPSLVGGVRGVAGTLGGLTPPARPVLVFILVALLLALPVVAHGCHAGDHDDEPLFAPPAERPAAPPR